MTTSNTPEIKLSDPALAVWGIPHGLILVSGEAHSGKTTTLDLYAKSFGKRMGPDEVIDINFEGNDFVPGQRSPLSFPAFENNAITADSTDESLENEGKRMQTWGNSIARTLTIPDPWVVIIDDMPAEFFYTALNMALTGRIVVASIPSKSAEEALETYAKVLEAQGINSARWLVKAAVQGSIHQKLVEDPKTGTLTLETYGIDVSKDSSDEKF
jgi:Tfp pilus assembly pilus retraction ATPase PilT